MSKLFYESGHGDRLIDESCYPGEIEDFLREEENILNSLLPAMGLLIEVGCMHGRYLDWAIAKGISYLGIDVVPRYIEEGKARLRSLGLLDSSYRLCLGDARELASVMDQEQFAIAPGRSLMLFPFNSFGNMVEHERVIQSLARAERPFFISSYETDAFAIACRKKYYEGCGYSKVQAQSDDQGVRFSSPEGLETVAYHKDYLLKLLRRTGITAQSFRFGMIGRGYIGGQLSCLLYFEFEEVASE